MTFATYTKVNIPKEYTRLDRENNGNHLESYNGRRVILFHPSGMGTGFGGVLEIREEVADKVFLVSPNAPKTEEARLTLGLEGLEIFVEEREETD
ncbi:MAG: hypothetical protein WC796_05780 [Candidatus Pacearchaeota archaeon]|jgi:hypothetical protein